MLPQHREEQVTDWLNHIRVGLKLPSKGKLMIGQPFPKTFCRSAGKRAVKTMSMFGISHFQAVRNSFLQTAPTKRTRCKNKQHHSEKLLVLFSVYTSGKSSASSGFSVSQSVGNEAMLSTVYRVGARRILG